MMAQYSRVVVGIDVAKDKVDGCIRSLSQRQTFPSRAEGRRKLIAWLRKHKVDRAVMEASGGGPRRLSEIEPGRLGSPRPSHPVPYVS
jgi:transposase